MIFITDNDREYLFNENELVSLIYNRDSGECEVQTSRNLIRIRDAVEVIHDPSAKSCKHFQEGAYRDATERASILSKANICYINTLDDIEDHVNEVFMDNPESEDTLRELLEFIDIKRKSLNNQIAKIYECNREESE
jgi:hypothetical protein